VWLAILLCLDSPHRLHAQQQTADFTLREWTVLLCDQYQPRANGSRVASSLPDFASTLRNKAPSSQMNLPSPIGVIRISGRSDQPLTVRLSNRSGMFRGCWPPASIQSPEILWKNLLLSAEPAGPIESLDRGHWLEPLRSSGGSWLTTSSRSDRFLLYDVELAYASTLQLKGGDAPDGPFSVFNSGAAPVRDLVLYRPFGNGLLTGSLSGLAPSTQPANDVPILVPAGQVFRNTTPSTQPAAALAEPSNELTLERVQTPSITDYLKTDWKRRLGAAQLDDADLELLARTIQAFALDAGQLTAVYRLDDSEMARLLPIAVTPAPRETRRVGLVIVRNIDPTLQQRIDALIAQLGNDDWEKREAASEALSRIGTPAEGKLRTAQLSTDAEVATRATRLLAPAR
jgi:hypothetical protein